MLKGWSYLVGRQQENFGETTMLVLAKFLVDLPTAKRGTVGYYSENVYAYFEM